MLVDTSDRGWPAVPKIESRKEFMEILQNIMTAEQPAEEEEKDYEEIEKRGRPRALKSYITESNAVLSSSFTIEDVETKVFDTNLPELKVLYLKAQKDAGKEVVQFYVDMQDPRFWVLHTNNLADDVGSLYRRLVNRSSLQLDKAWISSEMLEHIGSLPGNIFKGFNLKFTDILATPASEPPVEELIMSASGKSSIDAIAALRERESIRKSICYERLRVQRGTAFMHIKDEISFSGRFIVWEGSSIDNHIGLVIDIKDRYKKIIEEIEQLSIGVKKVEGRTLVTGQAYDLEFEREVEDYDSFVGKLVDPTAPFRLWGVKVKSEGETRRIVAVDLHTGGPLDLEIAPSLIRVYIPLGTCGNTLMRLYTNLQQNFDSRITIRGLDSLSA